MKNRFDWEVTLRSSNNSFEVKIALYIHCHNCRYLLIRKNELREVLMERCKM